MKKVRIEIHLSKEETRLLDALALNDGRSQKTAFEKVTLAAYDFGKFCKDNDYEFTSSSRFDNGYYEIVIVHYKTPISEPEEDKLEKDIANCFTPHDKHYLKLCGNQ